MFSKIASTDEIAFWMNAAGSKKVLTKEQVCLVARQIQSSPKDSPAYKRAVNKLVSHNLRLVIRSVNLFMRSKTSKKWGHADTLDLLQVGAMGLIRAAEKYDITTGYSFSTYATVWIRSFVTRYNIKTSSIFHIPEHACREAYAYEKNGSPMGKRSQEESHELVQLIRSAQSAVSLDIKLSDSDMSLGDKMLSSYDTSFSVRQGMFSDEMESFMEAADLSDLQVEVLRYLFLYEMKTKEIMEITGLSKSKISSIQKKALEKLQAVISAV